MAADSEAATFRIFFPTSERNDQRNNGYWGVDLKLVKRFN